MEKTANIIELVIQNMGGMYSRELGIVLSSGNRLELCKWFLAAKLFGTRISSTIAARTYREFERRRVILPEQILETGWDGLVEILDAGGYVRYDFSTATKLLSIMTGLKDHYAGDLNILHEQAGDEADLENRLKRLGKGIGDVTVNIFLRELRSVWSKARPGLSAPALQASRHLGLTGKQRDPLKALEQIWAENRVAGSDFRDFEAALVRLGKGYCRKDRHNLCPFRDICANPQKYLP